LNNTFYCHNRTPLVKWFRELKKNQLFTFAHALLILKVTGTRGRQAANFFINHEGQSVDITIFDTAAANGTPRDR